MQKPSQLAVLIDLDAEEPRLLGRILDRAADHGTVAIRRAYGDRQKLRDWNDCLQYRGIEPRASYGDGSNAADITLIIDAADMLRTGKADGFCIVADDHHFTGLVRWLRANGMFVAGIGGPGASQKLRDAFGEHFTDIDDLSGPDGARGKAERDLIDRIKAAIRDSPRSPDGYAHMSMVKDHLGEFDHSAYCHGGLASLVGSYGEFEVRCGESVGLPPGDYARIRPTRQ